MGAIEFIKRLLLSGKSVESDKRRRAMVKEECKPEKESDGNETLVGVCDCDPVCDCEPVCDCDGGGGA